MQCVRGERNPGKHWLVYLVTIWRTLNNGGVHGRNASKKNKKKQSMLLVCRLLKRMRRSQTSI